MDDQQAMTFISRIDRLNKHLFLSSVHGVRANLNFVASKIDVLFCVAQELGPEMKKLCANLPRTRIFFIPLVDSPQQLLELDQYAECLDTLIRNKQRVLVFCHMGISRSAAICIGYFMRYYGMTFSESEMFVKRKRSIIYPNAGFVDQLLRIEQ